MQQPSERTLRRVADARDELVTAARDRMAADYPWYSALSAEERSWVGLVAQAGIGQFIEWLRDPASVSPGTTDIFATAPRQLTRSLTLRQTLDLVRTVVEVVEDRVGDLAGRGDKHLLRELILRYSREVAFGAAEVYAGAAEARGAWDARLESLVVDAVLRGEADDAMESRASALGWGEVTDVTAVVGDTPRLVSATTGKPSATAGSMRSPQSAEGHDEKRVTHGGAGGDQLLTTEILDQIRRSARRAGAEVLATIQRNRLIVILGSVAAPETVASRMLEHFGPGPVVLGPTVPHIFAAGRSARAALSAHAVAGAWAAAPRPVHADDLLAERAMSGDWAARHELVQRVHKPLAEAAAAPLLETVTAYQAHGGALEATARELIVHVNTVRYRLGRVLDLTGYDVTDPREGFVVQVGLALGRLGPDAARPRPTL